MHPSYIKFSCSRTNRLTTSVELGWLVIVRETDRWEGISGKRMACWVEMNVNVEYMNKYMELTKKRRAGWEKGFDFFVSQPRVCM